MTPRILIVAAGYYYDEAMRELCKLWARVTTHLNPDIDIVLLDPQSPFKPESFLNWSVPGNRSIYKFSDNIGHLSRGGQDGSGRSFCKAFELAEGYDYLCFMESDILFFRPVKPIIQRMMNNGAKCAALPNYQYQFPEFGVSFFDVKWAKEFDFVGKYNWKEAPPYPIPEIRLMNMLGDYLTLLPYYGMRVDSIGANQENLSNYFPYAPPAWITHAKDFLTYYRAISLNNINME